MTTLTSVRPPAKTQYLLFRGQPATTLTTISTLFEEKNQKYPVSPVKPTACPDPFCPCAVAHATRTWNRPLLRHRVVASGTQGARLAFGEAGAVRVEEAAGAFRIASSGADAKALVSWIGTKATPWGFT